MVAWRAPENSPWRGLRLLLAGTLATLLASYLLTLLRRRAGRRAAPCSPALSRLNFIALAPLSSRGQSGSPARFGPPVLIDVRAYAHFLGELPSTRSMDAAAGLEPATSLPVH